MTSKSPSNISYIIEEVLLLDKSITLEFPNKQSFRTFKAMLPQYIRRYEDKMSNLGGAPLFEGKVPSYKFSLGNAPMQVELSMKDAEKKVPMFTIVKISSDESINKDSSTP